MADIQTAQQKILQKVRAARQVWINRVSSASSFDQFVTEVAAFANLSEATVRASLPAQNYQTFQRNAETYVDNMIANLERAINNDRYVQNYQRAFGGGG